MMSINKCLRMVYLKDEDSNNNLASIQDSSVKTQLIKMLMKRSFFSKMTMATQLEQVTFTEILTHKGRRLRSKEKEPNVGPKMIQMVEFIYVVVGRAIYPTLLYTLTLKQSIMGYNQAERRSQNDLEEEEVALESTKFLSLNL